MKRKHPELIRVPPEFKKIIDRARVEAGYNNKERQKFLRELCQSDDPLKELIDKDSRKKDSGGFDFGF